MTLKDSIAALQAKWREEASAADKDGDYCCALTREHDANDLDTLLALLAAQSEPTLLERYDAGHERFQRDEIRKWRQIAAALVGQVEALGHIPTVSVLARSADPLGIQFSHDVTTGDTQLRVNGPWSAPTPSAQPAPTQEKERQALRELLHRAKHWDAYDDGMSTRYLVADLVAQLLKGSAPTPSAWQPIENGNLEVFCADIAQIGGMEKTCIRGQGHNGPHAFCTRPYPQQAIVLVAPAEPKEP